VQGSWHSKTDKNSTDLYGGVSYYSLELFLEGLAQQSYLVATRLVESFIFRFRVLA